MTATSNQAGSAATDPAPAEQETAATRPSLALITRPSDEPSEFPPGFPDLRLGRSIFAELARERTNLYDYEPPAIDGLLDGQTVGTDFDAAIINHRIASVSTDKLLTAGWERAARNRTFGTPGPAAA